MKTALAKLNALAAAYFKQRHPNATRLKPHIYNDTNAQSLAHCITNWLRLKGHQVYQSEYIGSTDSTKDVKPAYYAILAIHAEINGQQVLFIPKTVWETYRPEQHAQIRQLSHIHDFVLEVKDFQTFYDWYEDARPFLYPDNNSLPFGKKLAV